MRILTFFAVGLIFGIGISVSGMANPAKVINFFDIAGNWDPSLAFVMGGALLVTFFGYGVVFKKKRPILADEFTLPSQHGIDRKLIGGSAVFGIGWGIAGFCPGAALPALGTGNLDVAIFVGSLLVGIAIARRLQAKAT
ncbi:DUF6691 family protein [Cochlodiniinecator piscidefendens]|uniref:DUF6691 family protein n=1 Tax=Cochlodiniinecator piscidefendens TaxID=2715756 RepID=UPI00140D7B17|nr:DUF6691 family protein [Cochlodiniinecator piscidefendens]